MHAIVGELIDAKNFYIALLSDDGNTVSFPYAADQFERDWSARSYGRGLTEYVLRTQRPALVTRDARADDGGGRRDRQRACWPRRRWCWLGAPLLSTEGAIGVVAVQSYDRGDVYNERDAELLTFVSYQIGSSLQRRRAAELLRQANAELEHRVEARTVELREQIAVREQVEAQLQHQVMHDALTGLPNRVYLRDRIERALAGAAPRRQAAASGCSTSTSTASRWSTTAWATAPATPCCKQVARRLAGCVREPDVVARIAGDEFVMLLEHVQTPRDRVQGRAARAARAARRRCTWPAARSQLVVQHRHRDRGRRIANRSTASCTTPTSRSIARRTPAATASCCSTMRCTRPRWACSTSNRPCAMR